MVIAVDIEGWDVIGDIEVDVSRIRRRQQLVSQSHHTATTLQANRFNVHVLGMDTLLMGR